MRDHHSPFSDLKAAAEQQAAATTGDIRRPASPPAEPATEPAAAPQTAPAVDPEPTPGEPKKTARRSKPKATEPKETEAKETEATGSVAAEIARLAAKSRAGRTTTTVDVEGFSVQVPTTQLGASVATTVAVPYELRAALRIAEQMTGCSYQELARLGLRMVLEQLHDLGEAPAE